VDSGEHDEFLRDRSGQLIAASQDDDRDDPDDDLEEPRASESGGKSAARPAARAANLRATGDA